MKIAGRAITAASAAAVLVGGCSTDMGAGRGGHHSSAPIHAAASTVAASPPAIADPRGAIARGLASNTSATPDADGNPACPAFDSWGAADGETGIVVAYWAHGADYVTVLVRTTKGPDVARSVNVEPGQGLQLFQFPDTGVEAVQEVLIITNDTRCYATPDPAMRGR
jgi:hypothetical protein